MNSPENRPNIEKLTEEAADMVEGNRKLADRTKNAPERGEGYRNERAENETAREEIGEVIKDYKSIINQDSARLAKMTPGSENYEALDAKIRQMNAELIKKEKTWGALQSQTEGQQELHKRFISEQELKAEYPSSHPVDFAAETVAAGDLDTEVALRTRLSGKLNTRNNERIEAEKKEKSERLMAEDREIIVSVKKQFEQLKTDHESRFQELLSAANIPENQEKVTEAIRKVEKLRKAWLGKENKKIEANTIIKDVQTWFNEKWGINVDIFDNEALSFCNQNNDRYSTYQHANVPTLPKITSHVYYSELPEAQVIGNERNALFQEIEKYWADLRTNKVKEMINQLAKTLNLDKLQEEES
jgi:hypothetical protein